MKEIQLTMGQVAIVDDDDYEKLAGFSWQAKQGKSGIWYAKRGGDLRRSLVYIHQQILGWYRGIDHIDGNGLNNQRDNLRRANQSINNQNKRKKPNATSQYLGVSWKSANEKWVAQIKIPRKNVRHLGLFENEIEAALAYDEAVKKAYRGHVKTNFSGRNEVSL